MNTRTATSLAAKQSSVSTSTSRLENACLWSSGTRGHGLKPNEVAAGQQAAPITRRDEPGQFRPFAVQATFFGSTNPLKSLAGGGRCCSAVQEHAPRSPGQPLYNLGPQSTLCRSVLDMR